MRIKIKWSTKLDIKKIVKEKRFKNTVITLLEILIVAGIIFGGLMFIQNKVTSEADKASKLSGKGVEEETENKNSVNNKENVTKETKHKNRRPYIILIFGICCGIAGKFGFDVYKYKKKRVTNKDEQN